MADVFSKTRRSEVMSGIRAKGNKDTEIALMRLLRKNQIKGWRRHVILKFNVKKIKDTKSFQKLASNISWKLQVTPDFVFRTERVVVFVDGCFWHGCPKHSNLPANNRIFWNKKLSGNEMRDRWVNKMLHLHGWHVVRVWEHELQQNLRKRKSAEKRIINRIHRMLQKSSI